MVAKLNKNKVSIVPDLHFIIQSQENQ